MTSPYVVMSVWKEWGGGSASSVLFSLYSSYLCANITLKAKEITANLRVVCIYEKFFDSLFKTHNLHPSNNTVFNSGDESKMKVKPKNNTPNKSWSPAYCFLLRLYVKREIPAYLHLKPQHFKLIKPADFLSSKTGWAGSHRKQSIACRSLPSKPISLSLSAIPISRGPLREWHISN